MIALKKNDNYVIFTPESKHFDDEGISILEKHIASLYSSEGLINFIVDLDKVESVVNSTAILFDKVHKIAKREAGVFVAVLNNDDVMDSLLTHAETEIVILSSLDEAIDLVYMNSEEDDYDEESDYEDENDY